MSVSFHIPSRRILVRGTNWLGDAVMTTPALLRLREKFPDAHIALLSQSKLTELWQQHPAINETTPFAIGESAFAIAKKLRAGKFDLALVLPNSPRSALETFLAHIPRRVGYSRPWRNFFLTQTVSSRAEAVKMRKRSAGEIRSLITGGKIGNRKSEIGNVPSLRTSAATRLRNASASFSAVKKLGRFLLNRFKPVAAAIFHRRNFCRCSANCATNTAHCSSSTKFTLALAARENGSPANTPAWCPT